MKTRYPGTLIIITKNDAEVISLLNDYSMLQLNKTFMLYASGKNKESVENSFLFKKRVFCNYEPIHHSCQIKNIPFLKIMTSNLRERILNLRSNENYMPEELVKIIRDFAISLENGEVFYFSCDPIFNFNITNTYKISTSLKEDIKNFHKEYTLFTNEWITQLGLINEDKTKLIKLSELNSKRA